MVRGSCLCRGIEFEAESIPLLMNCHCSMCRKAHGAAFSTAASVPACDFRFIRGEDLIQLYESSPGNFRGFCRVCGSNAPVRWAPGDLVFVPAGLLDDDPGVRPSVHLYVGSKAPWWQITDETMQLEEGVPGYGPNDTKS